MKNDYSRSFESAPPPQNIDHSKGFTLAEILITLGIIGVVASMTMPTLINKTNRKQDAAKIKKFYSTMSQAIILAENQYGSAADWPINSAIRDENGLIIDSQSDATLEFFNKYFAPYIKIISIGKDDNGSANVKFADGSVVYLSNGNCIDMNFDTNGPKKPNIAGKDRFDFLFCNKNYNENLIGKNKYFGTYVQDKTMGKNREDIIQICKTNRLYCSTLLLYDNWEFKDDYPW